MVSTFLSAHDDPSEASDPRAWSEEQLIAAAKTGRRVPFGELCERHGKKIFSVIYQMMRNREDAEDAVQDGLLNAFAHIKDFDERARFSTWLTRIAINAALTKLRKSHWKREILVDEPTAPFELIRHKEIQDNTPDPEEIYRLRERSQILNTAILRLRPRLRMVVELQQLQEHSLIGIAQILGISTATVKARMFHARVALRRMPLLRSAGRSVRANTR